jgi:hypothetical protein
VSNAIYLIILGHNTYYYWSVWLPRVVLQASKLCYNFCPNLPSNSGSTRSVVYTILLPNYIYYGLLWHSRYKNLIAWDRVIFTANKWDRHDQSVLLGKLYPLTQLRLHPYDCETGPFLRCSFYNHLRNRNSCYISTIVTLDWLLCPLSTSTVCCKLF